MLPDLSGNVGLHTVAPVLGVIVANAMFTSPLMAVLLRRKEGTLGELNPIPFAAIFGNCMGWLAYSFVKQDLYVFFSNAPGALLGLFFTFSAYGLTHDKTMRLRIESMILGIVALMSVTGLVTVIIPANVGHGFPDGFRQTFVGGVAVALLVAYYASPLSVLYHVLTQRCSAALNAPLSVASLINSLLWVGYGIAIGPDWFITAPNGVGVLLCLVQIACLIAFRGHAHTAASRKAADAASAGLEPASDASIDANPGKAAAPKDPLRSQLIAGPKLEDGGAGGRDLAPADVEDVPLGANGV